MQLIVHGKVDTPRTCLSCLPTTSALILHLITDSAGLKYHLRYTQDLKLVGACVHRKVNQAMRGVRLITTSYL